MSATAESAQPRLLVDGSTSASELRQHIARTVAKVCPSWMVDHRDDLVQVATLKVLELQSSGKEERRFTGSYLWKVAYSAVIDEVRRRKRRSEVSLDGSEPEDEGSLGETLPTNDPDPETRGRGSQIGLGIRDCLGALVQARRLAVMLYLQGHTVPDAAKVLEWTTKKTENLVYRGLRDLRGCLTRKGLEP